MQQVLESVASFVALNCSLGKEELRDSLVKKFALTKDRSVFYCDEFAIRFSEAKSAAFSNTVASLSRLRKYDDRPFLVCVVTPMENHLLLANSTMLKKVSHSSQGLSEERIRGSFNGSDIVRELAGIENLPENLARLYEIHAAIGFDTNLPRIVEATNNIVPIGKKFAVTSDAQSMILSAPDRACNFMASSEASVLTEELDSRVHQFQDAILRAARIDNVNMRGRIIECLIAGTDDALRESLKEALLSESVVSLPSGGTGTGLGDHSREFRDFHTETDVKTKIMVLSSNPKAYNVDKMLEFLSREKSVYLFYFVGVDPKGVVKPALVSVFQTKLLAATITLSHWAGRNSRGVTQFEGSVVGDLIQSPEAGIDLLAAREFLQRLISL